MDATHEKLLERETGGTTKRESTTDNGQVSDLSMPLIVVPPVERPVFELSGNEKTSETFHKKTNHPEEPEEPQEKESPDKGKKRKQEEIQDSNPSTVSSDGECSSDTNPGSKDKKLERTPKKRLIWTPALHKCFSDAVARLGEKAVPKKILKEMGVEGLTRENVASHLQKYRIQQKKLSQMHLDIKEKDGMSNSVIKHIGLGIPETHSTIIHPFTQQPGYHNQFFSNLMFPRPMDNMGRVHPQAHQVSTQLPGQNALGFGHKGLPMSPEVLLAHHFPTMNKPFPFDTYSYYQGMGHHFGPIGHSYTNGMPSSSSELDSEFLSNMFYHGHDAHGVHPANSFHDDHSLQGNCMFGANRENLNVLDPYSL